MIRPNPTGDLPVIAASSFIDPTAIICGKVVIGDSVFVGPYAVIRADEVDADGHLEAITIGDGSNIQDGVVIHALQQKHVIVGGEPWAVFVGRNVSMAHDALVHGPCFVGDDTFIGFKAVVHDSIVGPHCFIGIGAIVVGVEVPAGKFVPHGSIVDSPEAVAALPDVSAAQRAFNEDVVEVNRGLAAAYQAIGQRAALPDSLDAPPGRRGYDERF
jgi:SulP family sulfate permease